MMKKKVPILTVTLIAWLVLVAFISVRVYAAECDVGDRQPISITVVVPRPEDNQVNQAPTSQPNPYHIYPVHVWESREDGRRQIIRVYELREHENPAHIPRESFERDGFRFELAEVVRREMPAHSVREHSETVSVSTQTNDFATVMRLLSSTMEYVSYDGYFGVLALDISSIEIVSDGTRTTSHTATATREFPHLSSTDTSLVPRTITDGGRTYNLVNVEWRTQSTTAIDYTQVASTFTAVATYSRNATRTSTIGFTTTAVYRGQVSRIAVGRTEFTAYFIGIPIVTPTVNESTTNPVAEPETAAIPPEAAPTETAPTETTPTPDDPSPNPTVIENVTVEQVHIGGIVVEVEHVAPPISAEYINPPPCMEQVAEAEPTEDEYVLANSESSGFPLGNIGIVLLFIGGIVVAYFAGNKGKAMLGFTKKASCFVLLFILMFGISSHVAYAAPIPRYSFGAQSEENATHFNPNGSGQGSTSSDSVHFYPGHAGGQSGTGQSNGAIHFDPTRTDAAPRDSPATHFQPGSTNASVNTHNHNYGDVIGTLTVERLGRTMNVIAGATMEAMDFGAGHFSFTGLNTGNTGLIGHNRGSTNGFFSFVRQLREGDILTLNAGGIVRSYAVSMVFYVDETDFAPLMQFGDTRLTLVTCREYHRTQRRIAVAIALN